MGRPHPGTEVVGRVAGLPSREEGVVVVQVAHQGAVVESGAVGGGSSPAYDSRL
jgi:hypothetical protein